MSTVLTNGVIIPENGSRNWGGDLANNWNILDLNVGYMTDVKNSVTTLENSTAENTANIQTNSSNISALQTSKQDKIEDLETIRAGASSGATAVQPSALNNYVDLSSEQTIKGDKRFDGNFVDVEGYRFRIKNSIEVAGELPTDENAWTSNRWNAFDFVDKNNVRTFEITRCATIDGWTFLNFGILNNAPNNWLEFLKYQGNNFTSYISSIDFIPMGDIYSLGSSTNRWKDIYAVNGTINTSDRNAKTSIKNIDDNLLAAWGNVSLISFKFKGAVEKKGDNARIHVGYIAQDIQEELKKYGIDACNYGLFCYNSWNAQEEKSHEEERTNENGDVEIVKVIDTPAREAGETYGLRYIECLVVECAYLRKKNGELEDRIARLETNLNCRFN